MMTELQYRTITLLHPWTAPHRSLLFVQWWWRRCSFCCVSAMTMAFKHNCKDCRLMSYLRSF